MTNQTRAHSNEPFIRLPSGDCMFIFGREEDAWHASKAVNSFYKMREALDLARVLIKFHVPETACITIDDKQYSATDVFKSIIEALKAAGANHE